MTYKEFRDESVVKDGTVPDRELNDKSLYVVSRSKRRGTSRTHRYVKELGRLVSDILIKPCPVTALHCMSQSHRPQISSAYRVTKFEFSDKLGK